MKIPVTHTQAIEIDITERTLFKYHEDMLMEKIRKLVSKDIPDLKLYINVIYVDQKNRIIIEEEFRESSISEDITDLCSFDTKQLIEYYILSEQIHKKIIAMSEEQ
jgi:hypothetical protein